MISLTFDDGLDQHLDHAVALLTEYRLPAVFYLHLSAPSVPRRLDDWRQAARDGHELGNHSIFHAADVRKTWVTEGNAIDYYTLDRMRQELMVANHWLTAIDGQTERTFAYPCSNPVVGQWGMAHRLLQRLGLDRTRLVSWIDGLGLDIGSTRRSFEPLVGELFLAGRGGGLHPGEVPPPCSQWRRTYLPSVAVENWSVEQLRQSCEQALTAGAWRILQFHGVGGGHSMDCALPVFRDFVRWLADHHADQIVTVRAGVKPVWSDHSR